MKGSMYSMLEERSFVPNHLHALDASDFVGVVGIVVTW